MNALIIIITLAFMLIALAISFYLLLIINNNKYKDSRISILLVINFITAFRCYEFNVIIKLLILKN